MNTSDPSIESLITDLSSSEAIIRQRAVHSLIEIGSPAITPVHALAGAEDDLVRWECAKILAAIADPASIDTLLKLLEDHYFGAAWVAALGLAEIGKPAVKPLMMAIIKRTVHFSIIAGAHHTIYEMASTDWGKQLLPVYEALHSTEPAVSAPVAAEKVLEEWTE